MCSVSVTSKKVAGRVSFFWAAVHDHATQNLFSPFIIFDHHYTMASADGTLQCYRGTVRMFETYGLLLSSSK